MVVAVHVTELVKIIKEKIIVDNISFTVEEGEIFGMLGSNGSGKTTTFNMLSKLIPASSGSITILGKNIGEISSLDIGFVTQENSFYETLSVLENLEFFAEQFGVNGKDIKTRISKLLQDMKLTDKKNVIASNLSGGMKRRLNMACSLIHEPKIIFLDEPTVGLDPVVRREIWLIIKELHKLKKTIVITSHYMEEIEELCDRVAIMFMLEE